ARAFILSSVSCRPDIYFFFFPAPPPTELYTLSLHDALPILGTQLWSWHSKSGPQQVPLPSSAPLLALGHQVPVDPRQIPLWQSRSEEHTSELQSPYDLVCRLLLEKKKTTKLDTRHYSSRGT